MEVAQEIFQETNYNIQALSKFVDENEPRLVDDQKHSYNSIMVSMENDRGGLFFIDAPCGTGKTFLIDLLLANVRQRQHIALAVASSGIAATLLDGGRTAHSMFKLPLDLTRNEQPLCCINKNSTKGKLLQTCKLIIWDEATMSHKRAVEALDRTMKDFRDNTHLMGGVTIVLAGDFRQTLPVIPRGTRADQINACLKRSDLWSNFQRLSLTTNMRVHLSGDEGAGDFAIQLLRLGNGLLEKDNNDLIQLPFGHIIDSEQELIARVFTNIQIRYCDPKWLCERAILAPKNAAVTDINRRILDMLPGEKRAYKSVDTVTSLDHVVNYPTEFLNSLQPTGIPPHNLMLKLGASIMLLRNLDPPKLCNGTQLIIIHMMHHVLEATIMSGTFAGENCFIPRIPMKTTDLPFDFQRLQFPVRLSFAMTINKSQGQSMKVVGLNLADPVFSHGQLYVGTTRVGNPNRLFILAPQGKTKNIVYPEALE